MLRYSRMRTAILWLVAGFVSACPAADRAQRRGEAADTEEIHTDDEAAPVDEAAGDDSDVVAESDEVDDGNTGDDAAEGPDEATDGGDADGGDIDSDADGETETDNETAIDLCAGVTCDDVAACTDDTCNADTGACVFDAGAMDTQACDDGDPCTLDDACLVGACGGVPKTCDDENLCTDDSCNPQTGVCEFDAASLNDTACDDDNASTLASACTAGACVATPLWQDVGGSAWGLPYTIRANGSASRGGVSDSPVDSSDPAVALDGDGHVAVAWRELRTASYDVYMTFWDGERWLELGGSLSEGGVSTNAGDTTRVAITIDADHHPIVAWDDNSSGRWEIYLKRWNGSAWLDMNGSASNGGVSQNTGKTAAYYADTPSICSAADGNPTVAWRAHIPGNYEIYVKRWNGSAWVEDGNHSASETASQRGGVSDNTGVSQRPRIAINGDGAPVVVWDDYTSGNYEIYTRTLTAGIWVELNASASGGGISGTSGTSHLPALAINGAGQPVVAWEDNATGQKEILLRAWNGSAWADLNGSATNGGVSNTAASSEWPALATTASGDPVVLWSEYVSGQYEIHARQWNGATWTAAGLGSASDGGVSQTYYDSKRSVVAFMASADPVVAWYEGNGEIYVRTWDGAAWQELNEAPITEGGIGTGGSPYPALGLDAAGNPTIAWSMTVGDYIDEVATNAEIYVKRWTGSAWAELGGSATGGGISNLPAASATPEVAIDDAGNPFVAWRDWNMSQYEIYLKHWDGAAWAELNSSATGGGISNNYGDSKRLDIALDSDGYPVVAWHQWIGSGNLEIYVRRWDGAAFVEIGQGSATGTGISATSKLSGFPSLALKSNGDPVIAWDDEQNGTDQVYVREWNGTAWSEIGAGSASGTGISNNGGATGTELWAAMYATGSPSMKLDAEDKPIVAWADDSDSVEGDYEIYVRRWTGTTWAEMGVGAATEGGISDNAGTSRYPSLAIDAADNPVVAWADDSSGSDQIYVKRWDGDAWVEAGIGAASGGGVSNATPRVAEDNSSQSIPSLAIRDNTWWVTWWDAGPEGAMIMARRAIVQLP